MTTTLCSIPGKISPVPYTRAVQLNACEPLQLPFALRCCRGGHGSRSKTAGTACMVRGNLGGPYPATGAAHIMGMEILGAYSHSIWPTQSAALGLHAGAMCHPWQSCLIQWNPYFPLSCKYFVWDVLGFHLPFLWLLHTGGHPETEGTCKHSWDLIYDHMTYFKLHDNRSGPRLCTCSPVLGAVPGMQSK